MKKLLPIILSVIFILLSLASCGLTVTKIDNTTSNTEEISEESTTSSETQVSETSANSTVKSDSGTEASSADKTEKSDIKTTTTTNSKTTTTTTHKKQISCTITINCKTILDNMEDLDPAKKDFVPKNGEILKTTTVYVDEGSTAFDVLKTVCNKNKIHLEYRFTPAYNSYYIEGIHQLYEFDCGDNSGWMYSVNNVFPNKGCNMYNVKNGDVIKFLYTCDLGSDLGADV